MTAKPTVTKDGSGRVQVLVTGAAIGFAAGAATAEGRKASRARAPDSLWEDEGRTPEQPAPSENSGNGTA